MKLGMGVARPSNRRTPSLSHVSGDLLFPESFKDGILILKIILLLTLNLPSHIWHNGTHIEHCVDAQALCCIRPRADATL